MLGHRVCSEIPYLSIKLHGVIFHKIVPVITRAGNGIYFEICIYIALLQYRFSYYRELVHIFFNYRPASDKLYNTFAIMELFTWDV